MSYKMRTRKCSTCSNLVTGRIPLNGLVRCVDCGIKVAEQAARDMYNRDGQWYARWLKSAGPQGRPRKQPPRR